MNYLIQPKKYKSLMADEGSKVVMEKTVAFFENMGKQRLLDDYNKKIWYREFIDFLAREKILFKLLTPKPYAEGEQCSAAIV
jgi:acyl-CoA dehydrogenase